MSNDMQKASAALEYIEYMTVAVVLPDGKPWAVPVHVQKREGLSFYWDSSTDALHSRCLETQPNIMVMLFRVKSDGVNEFGFYGEAVAQIADELPYGRARYRATVKRAWINDELHQKRELEL